MQLDTLNFLEYVIFLLTIDEKINRRSICTFRKVQWVYTFLNIGPTVDITYNSEDKVFFSPLE